MKEYLLGSATQELFDQIVGTELTKEKFSELQKGLIFHKQMVNSTENEISEMKRAMSMFVKYLLNYDNPYEVLEMLDENLSKEKEFVEKYESMIKHFQSICNHKMKNVGHDSHYEYYRCDVCGYEERY